MRKRSTQLVLLIVVMASVSVFAWGCGSGEEEATTTTTAVVDVTIPVLPDPNTNPLVGTQLAPSESTPQEYIDAVAQAKPVVILFYVAGAVDDAKVVEGLSAVQGSFPDYTFLVYDYTNPDAYGDLSTLLEVDYPPQLVLVDNTGTIKEVWNGYLDEGTINQSLVNLSAG